jgi:calcium permeable stress-gated cation channel
MTNLAQIQSRRTRLKTINEDIQIAQEDGYQAIADGAFVKGWLLTGRGLWFLSGLQLIEGRVKEDVRWDVLQLEGRDSRSRIIGEIRMSSAQQREVHHSHG